MKLISDEDPTVRSRLIDMFENLNAAVKRVVPKSIDIVATHQATTLTA